MWAWPLEQGFHAMMAGATARRWTQAQQHSLRLLPGWHGGRTKCCGIASRRARVRCGRALHASPARVTSPRVQTAELPGALSSRCALPRDKLCQESAWLLIRVQAWSLHSAQGRACLCL